LFAVLLTGYRCGAETFNKVFKICLAILNLIYFFGEENLLKQEFDVETFYGDDRDETVSEESENDVPIDFSSQPTPDSIWFIASKNKSIRKNIAKKSEESNPDIEVRSNNGPPPPPEDSILSQQEIDYLMGDDSSLKPVLTRKKQSPIKSNSPFVQQTPAKSRKQISGKKRQSVGKKMKKKFQKPLSNAHLKCLFHQNMKF